MEAQPIVDEVVVDLLANEQDFSAVEDQGVQVVGAVQSARIFARIVCCTPNPTAPGRAPAT
jgi:hypothetical protein